MRVQLPPAQARARFSDRKSGTIHRPANASFLWILRRKSNMKTPLNARLYDVWQAMRGHNQWYQRSVQEKQTSDAYRALAVVAYDKLRDFQQLPHGGKKATAAVRFIETQASAAGLNLSSGQGF